MIFVSAVILSKFILLFLPSYSVALSYLNLAVSIQCMLAGQVFGHNGKLESGTAGDGEKCQFPWLIYKRSGA